MTIGDHDKYMSSFTTVRWFRAIYNAEQNPNRSLRFWALNPAVASWHRDTSPEPSPFLRVANVGFTRKDQSVYFAPRPVRPVTAVAGRDGAELGRAEVRPKEKLYVSFHESGAVNVHGIRTEYLRIRDAQELDDAVPLFTCGYSNFDSYEAESKPNDSGVVVAASGPADWPTFVSVFALRNDVQLDEGKPYVVLSHSPWETVISIGGSGTRYLFAGWTSPPETFRNA